MFSMTGYGSAVAAANNITVTVEVKSVNNRFLDCNVRLPRSMSAAEDTVKREVQSVCKRGKVDVYVSADVAQTEDSVMLTPNTPLIKAYIAAFSAIAHSENIINDFGTAALSKMPDIFTVTRREIDADAFSAAWLSALSAALSAFADMRRTEGGRLANDVLSYLSELEAFTDSVAAQSALSADAYRERLTVRMREVLSEAVRANLSAADGNEPGLREMRTFDDVSVSPITVLKIDEQRILTEVAVFADKVAVDEEIARLRSHISQGRQILQEREVGRKLDFLVQELTREVNTIGSKCSDIDVTRTVLEMKAVVEKIREQAANLE